MAYEKTEWKTGDIVTAEKLNKIENQLVEGGSGGSNVELIHIDVTDQYTKICDKTYEEVSDFLSNDKIVIARVTMKVYDSADDMYYTQKYDLPFVAKETGTNKLKFFKVVQAGVSDSTHYTITTVSANLTPSDQLETSYDKKTLAVTSI